jgi:hypothetical protein
MVYRWNHLTRIFHESPAATTDMAVLPGVLGCRPLRRTVQVRLGTNTLRLPGGTHIFMVSRQQFMKHPGYDNCLFSSLSKEMMTPTASNKPAKTSTA